jgi:hypothetical protein
MKNMENQVEDKGAMLKFSILPQPDDITCGPTCLHAVYSYYGEGIELKKVIKEVKQLKSGGTLAVFLGLHALQKGYNVTIVSYNLQMFDPTWFNKDSDLIIRKLKEQLYHKKGKRFIYATEAYINFLQSGGKIKFQELNSSLIKKYLRKSVPILTGLSATYLYNSPREIPDTNQYHDVKGEPAGHFVVINGFDKEENKFYISDPLNPNPFADSQYYKVNFNRLMSSILLGIVTYDANLLIISK